MWTKEKEREKGKRSHRKSDDTYRRYYLAIERQGRGINRGLHNGEQPMAIGSRKMSRVFLVNEDDHGNRNVN